MLNEGEPAGDDLRENVFTGEIVKILERGADHTLFFNQGPDDYDFEISLSNLAYRSLQIRKGDRVTVAFKWESVWTMPGERKSPDRSVTPSSPRLE